MCIHVVEVVVVTFSHGYVLGKGNSDVCRSPGTSCVAGSLGYEDLADRHST